MNESDLNHVVDCLESILRVFARNRDHLRVPEIRIQSMIAALRSEVKEQAELRARRSAADA